MVELGLRGSRLLVYAVVYRFSGDAESDYHGNALYIANWCGISKPQALEILKALTAEGFIERVDHDGRPHYRVAGGRKTDRSENRPDRSENRPLPPTTPLTISREKRQDIYIPSTARAREPEKIAFGDNVLLTADEHQKLVARFGTADTARLVEILDGYLSNPKKKNRYSSHYRAILSWCVNALQEEKLTQQRLKNAQEAAQRANAPKAPETHYADLAEIDARRKAIEDKYKFKKTN